MDADRLSHFRSLLEKHLASLETTAQQHQEEMSESHVTEDFVGGDRASELETMEVDATVAESEFRLAGKVQYALDRIAEGTYGICEDCGDAIPEARLEAKPSVSLCLPCQEKHEAES